jgi:hypothetical protein
MGLEAAVLAPLVAGTVAGGLQGFGQKEAAKQLGQPTNQSGTSQLTPGLGLGPVLQQIGDFALGNFLFKQPQFPNTEVGPSEGFTSSIQGALAKGLNLDPLFSLFGENQEKIAESRGLFEQDLDRLSGLLNAGGENLEPAYRFINKVFNTDSAGNAARKRLLDLDLENVGEDPSLQGIFDVFRREAGETLNETILPANAARFSLGGGFNSGLKALTDQGLAADVNEDVNDSIFAGLADARKFNLSLLGQLAGQIDSIRSASLQSLPGLEGARLAGPLAELGARENLLNFDLASANSDFQNLFGIHGLQLGGLEHELSALMDLEDRRVSQEMLDLQGSLFNQQQPFDQLSNLFNIIAPLAQIFGVTNTTGSVQSPTAVPHLASILGNSGLAGLGSLLAFNPNIFSSKTNPQTTSTSSSGGR